MTVFDPNSSEDFARYEERFLDILERTLDVVFDADPAFSAEYRDDLTNAPPLQRALALHDDPLDVASALTGLPLTAQRVASYEALRYLLDKPVDSRSTDREALEERTVRDILARGPRDERSPMVPLSTVNRLMSDLGYSRLIVRNGVAYFSLKKRKRPLPVEYRMESLPGETADRIQVYALDRVLVALRAMREFARRTRPASSILVRIDRMIDFLIRQTFG